MLDLLFLAGQAASALLLLYGGYLAVFSSLAGWAPRTSSDALAF